MGAHNAFAVYRLYGHLPATTVQLLNYMALVSLDHDPNPWFSMGHMALAKHALRREITCECGRSSCRACKPHLQAVYRGLKPALAAGALTVDRGPARSRTDAPCTTRYLLHLREPAALRNENPDPAPGTVPRSTDSVPHGLRNPFQRSTDSVPTVYGFRRPEEEEEEEERVEKEGVTSQGDLTTRAYPDEQANEIDYGEVGEGSPDAVRRDAAPAASHDEGDGESAKPQVTPVVRSTASPAVHSQGIDRRVSRPAGVPDDVARLLPPHLRPTRLRAS